MGLKLTVLFPLSFEPPPEVSQLHKAASEKKKGGGLGDGGGCTSKKYGMPDAVAWKTSRLS